MAQQVGQSLKGIAFDAFYTSPLRRAQETAAEIFASIANGSIPSPYPLKTLIEISLPQWEDMYFEEVKEKFPQAYRCWQEQPQLLAMDVKDEAGNVTTFYPGRDLFERAQQVWPTLLEQHLGQTLLIVAHSGINRALICTALGMGIEGYLRFQQANCGITVLNFPGAWGQPAQLEALNVTSHLGNPFPTPRFKEQTLRIFLVRHGETDWNRQGRFQGQIDVPLNPTGQAQGEQVAAFLKDVSFHQAISSPMLRPKATAEAILAHHPQVPLKLIPAFAEISHGDWEGKLEPEVESLYPGELHRWRQTPAVVQMPNGENLQQVWERAIAAWEQLIDELRQSSAMLHRGGDRGPDQVLVVAHDAINKLILCQVVGLGIEQFWHFKQGNGGVSIIDYPLQGGHPRLQAMNITTHLGGVLDPTAAGAL